MIDLAKISQAMKRRGTSLIETIVGFSLLVFCGLLSLGLIPSIKMANRRADASLQAGNLAQSLLDEQRSRPFDQVKTGIVAPVIRDELTMQPRLVVTPGVVVGSKRVRAQVEWHRGSLRNTIFRETILVRIPTT